MYYTLTSTRIEIIQGGKVIAFIEPPYFRFYPYFEMIFDNETF